MVMVMPKEEGCEGHECELLDAHTLASAVLLRTCTDARLHPCCEQQIQCTESTAGTLENVTLQSRCCVCLLPPCCVQAAWGGVRCYLALHEAPAAAAAAAEADEAALAALSPEERKKEKLRRKKVGVWGVWVYGCVMGVNGCVGVDRCVGVWVWRGCRLRTPVWHWCGWVAERARTVQLTASPHKRW